MSGRTYQVTIKRVSGSGNPIADKEEDGKPILVFGGAPGETVDIKILKLGSHRLGSIINPTQKQKKRSKKQLRNSEFKYKHYFTFKKEKEDIIRKRNERKNKSEYNGDKRKAEVKKQDLNRIGGNNTESNSDSLELRKNSSESAQGSGSDENGGVDRPDISNSIEKSNEQTSSSFADLRRQAKREAKEEVEITSNGSTQRSIEYSRSEAIKRYVKKRADGHCEGCREIAPFTSKTGKPYLHAHHIFELSSGGSDTADTVVALCPNCHYRVHHGQDGEDYNKRLYKKVQQIENSLQ